MIERKNRSVSAADLTEQLRAIHDQNPDATVLVNGDGAASYQHVINAIDQIKDAGVTRVSLLTRPVEGGN